MGGSQSTIPEDKHYVVVGGGYGGNAVAMDLKKHGAKFTIISNRDSFHHNIASVRTICKEGWAKKTMIPLKESFGDNFKLGKVVEVKSEDKKVLLESGEEISYDYLVLATGTTGPFPNKLESESYDEALQHWEKLYEKLKKAEKVLVIGGGATGVEQACEVKSAYPEKEVTLVHSSEVLVSRSVNDNFQNKARGVLNRLGVKLVLGQKIEDLSAVNEDSDERITLTTNGGETIETDMVLMCVGLKTNTDAYKTSFPELVEDGSNRLKVNEFLQVEGHDNIFAVGDCNNTADTKLGFVANVQAHFVVDNFKKLLKEQDRKSVV